MVGATGCGSTVTVAVAVVLAPSELVAVSVYVVVATGVTATLLPVTEPTLLSIEYEVAPLTTQVRVVLSPIVISLVLGEKL